MMVYRHLARVKRDHSLQVAEIKSSALPFMGINGKLIGKESIAGIELSKMFGLGIEFVYPII
ncbi:MAG TPA: hypothetical protein VK186_17065, partial [Candidatus Deferrimicrobium sp.]|nr:hypothetical protein [Candidatus Deferrimicrobium sp.]